jgi:hypothetical protein
MSMLGKRVLVAFAGLLLCAGAMAAEPAQPAQKAPDAAAPEPPDLPSQDVIVNGEVIEPDVKIIKREDSTIYEYRINGQLYMVKVQPVVGPPYYLVDRNGDGEFDSRSTDPTNISVPQWILLRW